MRAAVVGMFMALLALPAAAQTDADVYALIDQLRPAAESITIDGDAADWAAFPIFPDTAIDDVPGDPGREILSAAVAPLDQELLLLAELAGTPLAGAVYSVSWDFTSGPTPDVQIVLDTTTGLHQLLVFDEQANLESSAMVTGLFVGLGATHVEVAIPYSAILPSLPTRLVDALASIDHRSWIRASVLSIFTGVEDVADYGPSVGSYRLVATPYALDPPAPPGLPNAGATPFVLDLPLVGEWFLAQGPDGAFTHNGSWGHDWLPLTPDSFPSDPVSSPNNEDYPAFGQPLLAPVSGSVAVSIDIHPDNTPPNTGPTNNRVEINPGGGFRVEMFHLEQGSALVSQGEAVASGTQVGNVGNSGNSTLPHLHLQVRNGGTRPIAHPDVLVRLNQGASDPWQRAVALWEPRVGFHVANAPPPSVPGIGLPGGLAMIALIYATSLWSRRRRAACQSASTGSGDRSATNAAKLSSQPLRSIESRCLQARM